LNTEFKASLRWTAVLALPLFLIGGYFFTVHGGPGGDFFLIGCALFLPVVLLHDYFFSALPFVFPVYLSAPIVVVAQFAYWCLLIFCVRAMLRKGLHRG